MILMWYIGGKGANVLAKRRSVAGSRVLKRAAAVQQRQWGDMIS